MPPLVKGKRQRRRLKRPPPPPKKREFFSLSGSASLSAAERQGIGIRGFMCGGYSVCMCDSESSALLCTQQPPSVSLRKPAIPWLSSTKKTCTVLCRSGCSLHVSTTQDNYNGKYSSIIHNCRNITLLILCPTLNVHKGTEASIL